MQEERREQPEETRPAQEAGARGGAAAYAPAVPAEDVLVAWARTVVRWSPIWVGLLVAMGINLVLYILVLAVTLSSAGVAGRIGDILRSAGVWGAVASLIALFVGGFLAGRLGVQTGLRNGVLQGTLVWALYVILGLVLSVLGLGSFVGGLAGLADIRGLTAGTTGVSAAEAQRAISSAAESLWWIFGGLVVSWLAAAIGGWLGVMSARPETTERA